MTFKQWFVVESSTPADSPNIGSCFWWFDHLPRNIAYRWHVPSPCMPILPWNTLPLSIHLHEVEWWFAKRTRAIQVFEISRLFVEETEFDWFDCICNDVDFWVYLVFVCVSYSPQTSLDPLPSTVPKLSSKCLVDTWAVTLIATVDAVSILSICHSTICISELFLYYFSHDNCLSSTRIIENIRSFNSWGE